MESTDQDQRAPEEMSRLLTERDGLTRRLVGIDQRLEVLYASRQDDLSRRLGAIEDAIRTLSQPGQVTLSAAPAATAPSPSPTAVAAPAFPPLPQTPPAVIPHNVPPTDAAPTPPVHSASPSPTTEPPRFPPPSPTAPRIVGERVTVDAVALWSGPHPQAASGGWLPAGTRVFLTDISQGGRVQVMYQNRLSWVDPAWLATATPPPVAHAAPAPAWTAPAAGGAHGPDARPLSTPGGAAGQAPANPSPTVAAFQRPPMAAPAPPVPPTQVVQATPPLPRPWEHPGFVSKVLALVGAAVTLIGVGFLLVLAAQYGFFGPEARTVSAAGLGVALVVLAFIVRRRDERNVGAPILAATGVAAGFLSIVTATAIYHWLPPLLGAGLTAAIGLGGMVLARAWDNQWVALISVLGGLGLAAWVGSAEPVATVGLMVLMTGVTLLFERGTDWRLFPFTRVLPTVVLLLQIIAMPAQLSVTQAWWVAGMSVAVALLGLLSALIAPARPPAGQAIALGLLVPMVIPVAMTPFLLTDPVVAAIPLGVVALAFVVTGFVPAVDSRVRWALVPIGALFVLLALFTITEQRYIGVLTPAMGTVYLAVAARTRSRVSFIVGGALASIGVLIWVPQVATLVSQRAAESAGPEQILQSLAGIAAAVLATLATKRWVGSVQPWMLYLSWTLAILMGSVGVIIAGTWVGGHAGNPAAGYQTGQAVVTSAWMVLCAIFLRRGLAATRNEDAWLHLALAISTLAVAKLFLLDLGVLDAIARVGAFLAVGLLLLFVGTRYARAWERAHGDSAGGSQQLDVHSADAPAPQAVGAPAAAPEGSPAPEGLAADRPDEGDAQAVPASGGLD